jgi:hypothetical protein
MSVFHRGEIEVQARLEVLEDAERVGGIIASEIPPSARPFLRGQQMAVAASLDEQGRPWASLLTGPPGFIEAADAQLLRLAATPLPGDPLVENLRARPELGLLVIDLRTRRRLRLNGRGLASPDGVFLLVQEAYSNCPKYIQKRRLLGKTAEPPGAMFRSTSLATGTRSLIERADTFFIASWHGEGGADASHRGGRPGFVRVLDDRTLAFADYPGNNMFNTLGNLVGHPRIGLLFIDFERGDLVQLTGRARIQWEPQTTVRVELEEVRETPGGFPLRFSLLEPSPFSPPLAVTTMEAPASQGRGTLGRTK